MKLLITNIAQLVNIRAQSKVLRGKELVDLPIIENAYLQIEDGFIAGYGKMDQIPNINKYSSGEIIDVKGATILPTWCDSHTHLVFAASREDEFLDKLNGLTYAQIAAKGGGILNSAKKIATTSSDDLFAMAWERLQMLIHLGTGAIEIKSGYGLDVENELKMLRVIRRLKEAASIPIKASFLGAHTYPTAYKNNHEKYIRMIIQEMLPVISQEGLADFVDVFCEEGFFSVAETEQICLAALQYGLKIKLHANQLSASGAVELGVKLGAISVDHLEIMNPAAMKALSNSHTIGTLLPTAAFFLGVPYQPARDLIEANTAIALASDFNPGTSPSGNMNFVVSLSCIQLKLLPAEAINAATINSAYAVDLGHEVGSITVGKKANLIITYPIPSIQYLPYAFGTNLIHKVMINGAII